MDNREHGNDAMQGIAGWSVVMIIFWLVVIGLSYYLLSVVGVW